jgi:hypothetical protein
MRASILAAGSAAFLLSLVVHVGGASAAGGCGPGFHPSPYGCVPNRGPVVVAPGAPVVVAPAAPVVVAPAGPAVVVPAPVVCGRGYRWHPGFRRCVVL